MDTLKLYEDLAKALAPEAARKIAGALGAVYEELRQSVTQADFAELRAVVADLAEAEQRVGELAEAQSRTELEVRALTRSLKATREMVAGLSDSIGYGLENRAIARLPAILEAEHGVRVQGRLVRRFVEYPEGRRGRGEYPRGRPKG
jgi:DNA-binding transcriptional ArsR family regulator